MCEIVYFVSCDLKLGHSSSSEPSSRVGKKKPRSRNKDHPHHHPKLGCKFTILWDDTNQVGDEIGDKLHKKLSALAADNRLLPMDIPWPRQNRNNLQDAMKAVKVH